MGRVDVDDPLILAGKQQQLAFTCTFVVECECVWGGRRQQW